MSSVILPSQPDLRIALSMASSFVQPCSVATLGKYVAEYCFFDVRDADSDEDDEPSDDGVEKPDEARNDGLGKLM